MIAYLKSMKSKLPLFAVILLLTASAHADKITVGTYRTNEPQAKVFATILRVLTQQRYAVKFTDGAQGTIQADKTAWGSGTEYAAVFITVTKDGDGSLIEATFTRHAGIVGGGSPTKWADTFGQELKTTLPDLTTKSEKR